MRRLQGVLGVCALSLGLLRAPSLAAQETAATSPAAPAGQTPAPLPSAPPTPAATAKSASGKPVVTVATDGSGQFESIEQALSTAKMPGIVIQLKPGTYKEKLKIARNKVELRGLGAKPEDVVITYDDVAESAGGMTQSASLYVTGNDFYAENLTIQNDWQKTHSPKDDQENQSVALLVTGDRAVLRHVRILGYENTLYANSKTCHKDTDPTDQPCQASRQLFEDCYISGYLDVIFGDAKAVFANCELHALKADEVLLTSQGKLYPLEDSGYLFRDCTITAEPGIGKMYLGRPWRPASTVTFLNTKLVDAKLDPAGWRDSNSHLATSTFSEFNTGPGDNLANRVAGTHVLSKEEADKLTIQQWLAGADSWDPEAVH